MTETVNSNKLLDALSEPFAIDDLEWRTQSATQKQDGSIHIMVVPYIDSRAVMKRLDQVCGFNWQTNYDLIEVGQKEAFQCKLSIKVGDDWITRTDAAEITDRESVKGGHSNACATW